MYLFFMILKLFPMAPSMDPSNDWYLYESVCFDIPSMDPSKVQINRWGINWKDPINGSIKCILALHH